MTKNYPNLDALIQEIELQQPAFLRSKNLIEMGLYKTRSDLSWSIRRGLAPPSIKLSSHKVVFPRVCLCEWLKKRGGDCIEGGAFNAESQA